ncbi:hypothetical protein LXA43DRAFT_1069823 [Ganoderma leucocontextum]|nr:hypothetical protein LXA43DRAFT_1069823 [Ganoderma leucocontextum]
MSSTDMSALVLSGSCDGFPAVVSIDRSQPCTIVSAQFVLAHNLPLSLYGHSLATTAPTVSVPTPSGWLISTLRASVQYLREHDVVLGSDWCTTTHFSGGTPYVSDPASGAQFAVGVQWIPSSRQESGIMAGVASPFAQGVPVGTAPTADDRFVASSSHGHGSSLLVAGDRIFSPNVLYACRTLFPVDVRMHVFGLLRSNTRGTALCLAHGVEPASDRISQYHLLRHVVSGECAHEFHRTRFAGCLELAGAYEHTATLQQDLLQMLLIVLHDEHASVVSDVGAVLGLPSNARNVDEIITVLRTFRSSPPSTTLTDVTVVLDDLHSFSHDTLLVIADSHGLCEHDGSRSSLLAIIAAHIGTGMCARRWDPDGGRACAVFRDEIGTYDHATSDVDLLQMQLLRQLVKHLKLRGLRSLCSSHGVAFDSNERCSSLRRKLNAHITSLSKGKRVNGSQLPSPSQRRSARERDAHDDRLSDARRSWPRRLSSEYGKARPSRAAPGKSQLVYASKFLNNGTFDEAYDATEELYTWSEMQDNKISYRHIRQTDVVLLECLIRRYAPANTASNNAWSTFSIAFELARIAHLVVGPGIPAYLPD